MTSIDFSVVVGVRFGPINFNSSFSNLVRKLGRPDRRARTEDGLICVEYVKLKTEFYFNDNQVVIIASGFPKLRLFNKPVIGARLEHAIDWFRDNGYNVPESQLTTKFLIIEDAGCVLECDRTTITKISFSEPVQKRIE